MINFINKIAFILSVIFCTISCDNANSLLDQHIKDGPIIYAAKVNEIDIQSGLYRIRVNIYPAEDVNRSHCIVSWNITNEIKDSVRVDYIEENYDKDLECFYTIIDFTENDIQGNLLIETQNIDTFGNKSLINNKGAFIYGSIYTSTLLNDGVVISRNADELVFDRRVNSIGNLVSYEQKDGSFTEEVFITENAFSIVNPKPGGIVKTKTKYLINKTDIDKLEPDSYLETKIPETISGANFSKFTAYDYSDNDLGSPTYPTFTGHLTRGTGFDGNNVLIVTRHAMGSHLLKVEDLKNGKTNPIPLNMTSVSGGIFPVNRGEIIDGHTYVINLSGQDGLKIYHWENPTDIPDLIIEVNPKDIEGAGDRHGDNYSMNLDENGNGYIFLGANNQNSILRFTIQNYTNVTETKVLDTHPGVSNVMTMNQVEDTDYYLLSGYGTKDIYVVDNESSLVYTLSSNAIPIQGVGARVISFNGERYLMLAEAPRSTGNSILYVYDITRGSSIIEAFQLFEESGREAIFKYSLGGSSNVAPGTDTGYKVLKDKEGNDSILRLYAGSNNAGFTIIDVPKLSLGE